MKRHIGKHDARRAAAKDEPSPVTALRDLLATSFAADIAAVAPMVCDVLRDEMASEAKPARRKAQKGALHAIEGHGGALALDVARAYRQRFDKRLFGSGSKAYTLSFDDTTSIMDDSKLQRVMAMDNCAARLREQSTIEIYQLSTRLGEMVGKPAFDDSSNPLMPRVFCSCLVQGLKALGLRGDERFEAFMAFSPALLHIIPDLYAHANELLVQRGVLATFKAEYGKPVTKPAARAATPKVEIPTDPKEMAALLERLLRGQGRAQPVAA